MASLVDISNMALAEVGEQTITTLADESTPARLCRRLAPQAVKETLEAGLWKAARKAAYNLGQLTAVPDFGWAYAYELPVDYLRMKSFNEVDTDEQWQEMFEVQGRQLLTDESTVSIVYICDLTYTGNSVADMGAALVKACYLNLASKLAWPLQQSRTLKDKLEEDYERALARAKTADAREEFRPVTDPASGSRWIPARN